MENKNSASHKRYKTYLDYTTQKFGGRLIKVPLDAGFTCPTVAKGGGCIFCTDALRKSPLKSADVLREEYAETLSRLTQKWPNFVGTVVYLQSGSNTFAPPEYLEVLYTQMLQWEGVNGMSIATRPDCIDDGVLGILDALNQKTFLTVELGLQTSNDVTARQIGRGYAYQTFLETYRRLKARGIRVCVHMIDGLPDEDEHAMLQTAKDLAALEVDAVKIHLLHILDGTPMAERYKAGHYHPLERSAYVNIVCDQLGVLPKHTAIERITGDGNQSILLAPQWSRNKKAVFAAIDREMKARNLFQGDFYLSIDAT